MYVGHLYFTDKQLEAKTYQTELDAKVDKCYILEMYNPKIVKV